MLVNCFIRIKTHILIHASRLGSIFTAEFKENILSGKIQEKVFYR
jgi:hypothetical protein